MDQTLPSSGMGSPPDRPPTATQHVVARLRAAILSGALPSGAQLRQEELAASLGVSRTPVRESLRVLETEGWVVFVPHRGAVVAALSGEEAREIFDMRLALEAMALEKSVPLLTDADFDAAEALIAAMDAETDIAAWVDLNRRFHLALYVGAGPRLRAAILSQYDAVDRYLRLELVAMNNAAESQSEHRAILAACRARDVAQAVRLYHLHIAEAGADLAEALERKMAADG